MATTDYNSQWTGAQIDEAIGKALDGLPAGVCDTAAATADKIATVDGSFELAKNAVVLIKMTNTNSAASPTLNVNGTGAKPIMRYGTTAASTASTSSWNAGSVVPFLYDGTNWMIIGWINTTYSNAGLGQGYATCTTAAATAAKAATLSSYTLAAGGIVAVKFSNDVPAGATLNVNSKGAKAIYYKGAAIKDGVIKAGDVAYFIYSTYYHLLGIDRVAAGDSIDASSVKFTDGKTFQQKYDAGELTGPAGKDGANGTNGTNGKDGAAGKDGTSAYEAAQAGGYSGTEDQFNTDLAQAGSKASAPIVATVVLFVKLWANNTQTVAVPGVVADETAQLILPCPLAAIQDAYREAGVRIASQAENSLTFRCDSTPSVDLPVHIWIQNR